MTISEDNLARQTWRLLDESCEGNLAPEQQTELNDMLRTSEACRRAYREFMYLHGALTWDEGHAPVDGAEVALAKPPRPRARVLQLLARPTPLSITVATLVVGLVISTLAMIYLPPPSQWRGAAAKPEVAWGAKVIGLHNAAWAKWQQPPALGEMLAPGDDYSLLQGLVEIQLPDKSKLIFEGPSIFALSEPHLVNLERGKLAAVVTFAGRGLTVETPSATLVDLGTAFGVVVDEQGEVDLSVTQGMVQLRPSALGAAGRKPLLVHANQRALVKQTGDITRGLASEPEDFTWSLTQVRSAHVLEDDFESPHIYSDGQKFQPASIWHGMIARSETIDAAKTVPGALVLKTSQGNGSEIRLQGTAIYREVEGDFDAEVHVAFAPVEQFQTHALVAFTPDLRKCVHVDNIAGTDRPLRFRDYSGHEFALSLPQQPWLRLTRHGDTFRGYYSRDGQSWTMIGRPIQRPDLPARLNLGLAAWPGDNCPPFEAQFDHFRVEIESPELSPGPPPDVSPSGANY